MKGNTVRFPRVCERVTGRDDDEVEAAAEVDVGGEQHKVKALLRAGEPERRERRRRRSGTGLGR